MFGKPHWFRPKKIGWGLTPITWQGWVYTLVWACLIAGVFNLLLFVTIDGRALRIPEACIWLAVSIGALIWETRGILKAIRAAEDDKRYFIGDDDGESHVTTRNYDLHVRD